VTASELMDRTAKAHRRRKGPSDGGPFMASYYMGLCPRGDGRINATYMFVVRRGLAYHAGCDPEPPANVCQRCGAAVPPHRDAVCDGCGPLRYAVVSGATGRSDFVTLSAMKRRKGR